MAETPEAFDAWLERQRRPAEEPSEDVLARGREVFGAIGCGACHAVRGTEWTARIAPRNIVHNTVVRVQATDEHDAVLGRGFAEIEPSMSPAMAAR